MKKFLLAVGILLATCVAFAQDANPAVDFDLSSAEVTGLIYGPGASSASAIVSSSNSSSIIYENSLYWVDNGQITSRLIGDNVIEKVPEGDRLSVANINSSGVTLTYRGETLTIPLKGR